jgi:hypothetical protein
MHDQPIDVELPDPGEPPVLDWIDKDLIDADPLYQRPLDVARVETLLAGFSWRSFGALVIVPQTDGRYHVTDGQHRLAAAKRHPKVSLVPAIIVKAEDVPAEAGIFVAVNRNRKNVSALELFFAQLAAGDDTAEAVLQVCQTAGVRIPKHPGAYRPGDSIAVGAIQALLASVGPTRAIAYLRALTDFAPITAMHIKAVEHLMTDPEFRDSLALDDLATAVKSMGKAAETEAKRFAATHCVSTWKGLASTWFQKSRKRRAPPRPVEPAASFTTIVPHAIPSQRNVTKSVMGDPEPGRSALDQRRAAG